MCMWRRGWSHRTVVICCARVAKWQKHLRATQGQGCCPLTSQSQGSERPQGSAQKLQNRSPAGQPQISSWLRLHRPECVVELPADDKGENEEPTNTHDRNPNHHQTASKLECHQVTASHWESVRNEVSSRRCPKTKALHACVQACLQTASHCGHPHPERPALWDSNFVPQFSTYEKQAEES